MNAEELRELIREGGTTEELGDRRIGQFSQWWWHRFLNSDQRREFMDTYGNDDIRLDLLTLDDESLMFAWAVFKM